MSQSHAETAPIVGKPAHSGKQAKKAASPTRKILAAVDGSERTNRIVEYLMTLARSGEAVEVIVLNIQPKPADGRLRGYGSFKRDEVVDRLINELGSPVVASVGRMLDRAGLAHKERIELGEPVQTIIRCAKEEGCNVIVVGEPRPGAVRRWLAEKLGLVFGSVAAELVQLAETPVLIVK